MLRAEQVREQSRQCLDRHGWDVAEDDETWRRDRARRMAEEYAGDDL